MTKRLLFISIAFPPKSDPECIQAARYYYYMSRDKDILIDVVTSKNPTLFMPVDATLGKFSSVRGQLIEIPAHESKYLNFLVRKIRPDIIARPDSKMTFHWQWRKVVNRLREVPDVIYSRSNPLSSAVMGMKLSKYFNRPWILHLSDPWTENVLCHYSEREFILHSRMEEECFQQAAVLSFTSERTLRLYQKKYPQWSEKMQVFPNVYDPEEQTGNLNKEFTPGLTRIVYTGGLANTRTALTLLEALQLTVKKAPWLLNRFRVIFAGETDRRNDKIFARFASSLVSHLGRVSFQRAMELQNSADLLVVIDSVIPDPAKAVFFPSKLLDYARLEKPMLAITTPGSVTQEFVASHGGVVFFHDAAEQLSEWLQLYLEGYIQIKARKIDRFYAADEQAARLIKLVKMISM